MTRFIPRGQSRVQGEHDRAFDRPWYDYLRSLGVDLDSLQSDVSSHTGGAYGHGWTALTDQAIATGSNSIAHGLSTTPTEVMMVKDLAPRCLVEVYRAAAFSGLTQSNLVTIPYDTEVHSPSIANGAHSAGVVTLPHTGFYTIRATANISSVLTQESDRYSAITASSAGIFYDSYFQNGPDGKTIISQVEHISLAAGETIEFGIYQNAVASGVLTVGRSGCRLTVISDDNWTMGAHDATNITIHSARARTMSFLVR